MRVRYKIFKSAVKSWDYLFEEAAKFATRMGQARVIGISHSCSQGHQGVVTVWYWDK